MPQNAGRRPRLDGPDGPLPLSLAALTVVAGLVDSVSYLVLGKVFVANMTGNLVFVGFGLAGSGGLSDSSGVSAGSSGLAIGAFVVGALAGGWLARPLAHHRGWLLLSGTLGMTVLAAVALGVLWNVRGEAVSEGQRVVGIVVLAAGMGLQTAIAGKVAVTDMRTTVVTSPLAGLAAGVWTPRHRPAHAAQRATTVLTMLVGALCGGLLLRYADPRAPLVVVIAVLLVTMAVLVPHCRGEADWHRTAGG